MNQTQSQSFLFSNTIPVAELEVVKRTGTVFQIGVGKHLLGRVLNALAEPIDGGHAIQKDEWRSIEAAIPGIIDRSPVNESLETGILSVDALFPIEKAKESSLSATEAPEKHRLLLILFCIKKAKMLSVFMLQLA